MIYRLIIAFGFILIMTSPVLSQNQVLINEIMASNYESCFDEDYDSPDWIELFNNSSSSVNLKGYRISDKNNYSNAWELPDTTISAKARIVIFASEKNRNSSNKYYIQSRGYGVQPYYPTDRFRFQFLPIIGNFDIRMRVHSLRNVDFYGTAGLMMREEPTKGSKYCGVFCLRQDRNKYSFMYRSEDEQIPAITYSNYPLEYPNGWIRLKRETDSVFASTKDDADHDNLIGTYYYPAPDTLFVGIAVSSANEDKIATAAITDLTLNGKIIPFDTLKVEELEIEKPGKSYLSNEIHTNFKLDADGEKVYLWNKQGELIDTMNFPVQTVDISYGRYPEGSNNRELFSPPTPGEENQQGATSYAEEPKFSVPAGWYQGQILLNFENTNPNLKIRYSIDGTDVSDTSTIYEGDNLFINKSTSIRARAYQNNLFPSKEIVNTYIINDSCKLPVVLLTIDPFKLWDSTYGIFMSQNLWPAQEISGYFELFDTLKDRYFSSHSGIRVHGYNSRSYAQKSLRLASKSKYGSDNFKYKFFGNEYLDNFKELILRNSGIDWQDGQIRDAFCAVIAEQIPSIDASKYRPHVSFLNGQYWGLYELRERLDENYISYKYNLPKESISMLENNEHVITGSYSGYENMLNKVMTTDLTKSESYKILDSLICLGNIIDYTAMELFCNNFDWPWNNMKFWSSTSLDGKWRWILHDLDWTFGLWGAPPDFNLMPIALKPDTCEFSGMFVKMLGNQKFKQQFINRFADLMNSIFLPDRLTKIIDSLAQAIEPEINRHRQKWGKTYEEWQSKIYLIKLFAGERAKWQREHIVNYFSLEGISKIQINSNIKGAGDIKINTLDLTNFPWEGYYFNGIPIPISVTTSVGYNFIGWSTSSINIIDSTSTEQLINLNDSIYITANFEKIRNTDSNIVINEIMYKASDLTNSEDWIELYNPCSRDVDLGGWSLMDAAAGHTFKISEGTIIKGNSYIVISRDTSSFNSIYSGIEPLIGNLPYGYGLPDQVRLYDNDNIIIDSLCYFSTTPWPSDCEGTGKSLELINPSLNNVLGEYWQSSKVMLGTPGRENSVYVDFKEDFQMDSFSCYPNPFEDFTTIKIILNDTQRSKIEICNIFGQSVKSITDKLIFSGKYVYSWNGTDDFGNIVSDGLYFCIITNRKSRQVFRLIKCSYKGKLK